MNFCATKGPVCTLLLARGFCHRIASRKLNLLPICYHALRIQTVLRSQFGIKLFGVNLTCFLMFGIWKPPATTTCQQGQSLNPTVRRTKVRLVMQKQWWARCGFGGGASPCCPSHKGLSYLGQCVCVSVCVGKKKRAFIAFLAVLGRNCKKLSKAAAQNVWREKLFLLSLYSFLWRWHSTAWHFKNNIVMLGASPATLVRSGCTPLISKCN